jgi:hypothetical protein
MLYRKLLASCFLLLTRENIRLSDDSLLGIRNDSVARDDTRWRGSSHRDCCACGLARNDDHRRWCDGRRSLKSYGNGNCGCYQNGICDTSISYQQSPLTAQIRILRWIHCCVRSIHGDSRFLRCAFSKVDISSTHSLIPRLHESVFVEFDASTIKFPLPKAVCIARST